MEGSTPAPGEVQKERGEHLKAQEFSPAEGSWQPPCPSQEGCDAPARAADVFHSETPQLQRFDALIFHSGSFCSIIHSGAGRSVLIAGLEGAAHCLPTARRRCPSIISQEQGLPVRRLRGRDVHPLRVGVSDSLWERSGEENKEHEQFGGPWEGGARRPCPPRTERPAWKAGPAVRLSDPAHRGARPRCR